MFAGCRTSDDKNVVDSTERGVQAGQASLLDKLRRTRLDGALVLARTAQHHLNNPLALTVGCADMVANDPRLQPDLRECMEQVVQSAQQAAETVDQLRRVTCLEEAEDSSPVGPVANLTRSIEGPAPN